MKFVHIAPVEPKTEYTPRKAGNEHCSGCEHFEVAKSECNGPNMIRLTQKPKLEDGNVKVAPTGWCKFWEAR